MRDLRLDSTADSNTVEKSLHVLAPFMSLPEGTRVRVVSVRSGAVPGTWLLRLQCDLRRDCLPFDAILRVAELSGSSLDNPDSIFARLASRVSQAGKPVSGGAPLARRGDPVELVEEVGSMRLRAKGICLESGGLGERIRVQTGAAHRILLATVVGQGLVQVEQ